MADERAKVKNLGTIIGGGIRDYVEPAINTGAGAVADAVTLPSRAVVNAGQNIVAGYRDTNGVPFEAFPQTTGGARSFGARELQQGQPNAMQRDGIQSTGLAAPITTTTPQAAAPADSRATPVRLGAPGGVMQVNLSPHDREVKANVAAIDAELAKMAARGEAPSAQQLSQIAEIKQQAGFLRGGTDRQPVGPDGLPLRSSGQSSPANVLSVAFDGSVSPEAKKAFMEIPGRPIGPDGLPIRYWGAPANAGVNTQGMRAAENADRILHGSRGQNGPPELYSPSSSATWGGAAAEDRKAIESATARRDYFAAQDAAREDAKTQLQADIAALGFRNQADIAAAGNDKAMQVAQLNAASQAAGFKNQADIAAAGTAIQAERNKILASEAASQNELRAAQTAASKFMKVKVPTGPPNALGETPTREVLVDQTGKVIDPAKGAASSEALQELAAGLSPDQRAKAAKYIKANPSEDKAAVLAKIRAGEL